MKKIKGLQLALTILSTCFLVICCETPAPVVKTSASPNSIIVATTHSPSPNSFIKKVNFSTRPQAFKFLKCLIGTSELSEPKPSLLDRDITNMENGNPSVTDAKAIEIYTKHVNDILRIYPSTFVSCKNLEYIDIS